MDFATQSFQIILWDSNFSSSYWNRQVRRKFFLSRYLPRSITRRDVLTYAAGDNVKLPNGSLINLGFKPGWFTFLRNWALSICLHFGTNRSLSFKTRNYIETMALSIHIYLLSSFLRLCAPNPPARPTEMHLHATFSATFAPYNKVLKWDSL